MTARPRIAVIGAGAMGELHARTIASSERADLGQVVDLDPVRAAETAMRFGGIATTPAAAIHADAVVIAAPTDRHVELAADLLSRRIPVLVEKPLAPDAAGVQLLLGTARANDTVLMCGFVERFNPVVVTVGDLLDEPFLHFVSVRHSPPAGRPTSHVASDLLIHDVDLALRLHAQNPTEVRLDRSAATRPEVRGGLGPTSGPIGGEVADLTLSMPGGALATLSASRIGQRKVREIRIMTRSAQYELDLLRHDITIYRHVDHGPGHGDASYRSETVIEVPFVRSHQEPLASQLDHFCDLIAGDADPVAERAGIWMPHQLMDALCRPEIAHLEAGAGPNLAIAGR